MALKRLVGGLLAAAMVVAAVVVTTTGATSASAAQRDARAEAQVKIDKVVTDFRAMGASAFRYGGDQSWTVQAGRVSSFDNRPITENDHIRIGSLTKPFVSTVVLQLVAEGKVALDGPIEQYLPGLVAGNGHDGTKITVRHLLQHTSGIRDYLGTMVINPLNLWATHAPAALARNGLAKGSNGAPGAVFLYSNTNYIILGMMIEKITAHSLTQEIHDRITAPHDLTETELPPAAKQRLPEPFSFGYTHLLPSLKIDTTHYSPTLAWASGAVVSTGRDVGEFFALLAEGKLLPPAQQAELVKTFTDEPYGYGLGLIVWRLSCGMTAYGHNGVVPGFVSVAFATADGRQGVATTNANIGPSQPHMQPMHEAVELALCA